MQCCIPERIVETDICVYGGTSGKVISAECFLKLTVSDIDDDYKTMEVVLDPANRNSGFIRWTPVPKQ